MAVDILLFILIFSIYAAVHSWTAGLGLKSYIRRRYPVIYPFYRLLYTVFSLASLGLAWVIAPKPFLLIYELPYPYDILIILPKAAAAAGALYTFRYFDGMQFLGIRQSLLYIKSGDAASASAEADDFTEKGPYRYSRHPLYLYSILFLVFQPYVDLVYLLLTLIAILYFYIGSVYEERKLIVQFGDRYREYKKRVPRIFPWDYF